MRESPSIEIIKLLKSKGSNVAYSDPYFKEFPKLRNSNFNMKNVVINEKNLLNFDAVILVTDHDDFDYKLIKKYSSLIIDTRGKYIPSSKVIRAKDEKNLYDFRARPQFIKAALEQRD